MEMGGIKRKGGDYKVLGKMSAVVLFLFSFYFGGSLFVGGISLNLLMGSSLPIHLP